MPKSTQKEDAKAKKKRSAAPTGLYVVLALALVCFGAGMALFLSRTLKAP